MRSDLSGFWAVVAIVLIIGGINILLVGRFSPNQSFSLGAYEQYVGIACIVAGLLLIARLKLRAQEKQENR
jgi:uncharacterized membrane protein HdeD (DUF308 family)